MRLAIVDDENEEDESCGQKSEKFGNLRRFLQKSHRNSITNVPSIPLFAFVIIAFLVTVLVVFYGVVPILAYCNQRSSMESRVSKFPNFPIRSEQNVFFFDESDHGTTTEAARLSPQSATNDEKDLFWYIEREDCERDSGFYCGEDSCIPSAKRCDGHVDCADESDETDCTYDECGYHLHKCANETRCYRPGELCDAHGAPKCANASTFEKLLCR